MIEVKNLTKRFDGFTALNGLTMTVPTGSVYGLVGPNGAGKSTIIRHITGVYLSLIHISEPRDRQKSRMPSSA